MGFKSHVLNYSSDLVWNESTTYNSGNNLEYNCILIKGKYLGYGGFMEERFNEDIISTTVNNDNGYMYLMWYYHYFEILLYD